MQNLHHLRVELGIAPLQVILNLVRMYLIVAENFGNRSAPQLDQAPVAGRFAVLADMPGQ